MKITKKLGDIASIWVGHPLRGTIPDDSGSGIYMVQPRNIDEFCQVDWSSVVETKLEWRGKSRWLDVGDVIFRMNGRTNHATFIDKIDLPDNARVACHHQFFHLKVHDTDVNPAYLAWFINLPEMQEVLAESKLGVGTGPVVNRRMLSELSVGVPSAELQKSCLELWSGYVDARRASGRELAKMAGMYHESVQVLIGSGGR
ncbi:Uncharacterised protein [Zhongshania aliphaticivorans]|nr:Uncharacterised protein [Zhongshania aliphaticivorans]